jgi:predicted NBD/HSP70 family sugar kinase
MSTEHGQPLDAKATLNTPSDSVRAVNTRRIIRAVMAMPSTQVQLARRTRLSQATVSGVVGRLQREGVFEVEEGDERGKRIRLASMRGVAVGVEVGHEKLTVAVRRVDSEQTLQSTGELGVNQVNRTWAKESARLIDDLIRRTGLTPADVVSIGLGIPAAVDPRTGKVTQAASSLDWNLSGDLHELYEPHYPGVPVVVDNSSNLAAFGEHLYGAGRDAETMLFVKASTGIGSGLIIGGVIFRGRHGFAGEIGHLTMDPRGIVCRCGNRGCLETLVGGARLVDEVRQAYAGHRIDLPMNLSGLIERARNNDPVCLRVLQDAGRNIGLALARVCNIINPEVIVLGGELGRAGDTVLEYVTEELQRNVLIGMLDHPSPVQVLQSELGLIAGAQGALAFALNSDHRST